MFSVQRYCTRNDVNGNPRRVFVVRDAGGRIVATVDEGYEGRSVVYPVLSELLGRPVQSLSDDAITDLGDVDVTPSVYRRMRNYH